MTLLALAAAFAACGGSSTSPGAAGAPPASGAPAPGASSDGATPPGGSTGGADGGPTGATPADDVQIVVEPSDKAAGLLAAIQGAKSSVHMTMYLLDDPRFLDALAARHAAGVDVKVILNQTFSANAGSNASAYSELQAAGVDVRWAPSTFTLTHEKCVVIDGAQAWIMTMNLEKSSPSNREYLAIDTQPKDVAEAEAIFAADFANQPYTPSGDLLVAPHDARPKLVALVQGATKSVDLEGEELSDYQVVDALVAAKKAGAAVRVVLASGTPPASQASAVQQLEGAGVQVVTLSSPYVHAKALVVDGARAYVGSENFTTGSLEHNRELGLVTTNPASVATVAKTIAADFAAGH